MTDKTKDLNHQIKILTAEKTELLRLVNHWKAEAKRYQELYYDVNQEDEKYIMMLLRRTNETRIKGIKALEAEIFPQRKSKRVHIQELQEAWAAHVKTLEPWWTRWLKR